jgi:hypothetical protein
MVWDAVILIGQLIVDEIVRVVRRERQKANPVSLGDLSVRLQRPRGNTLICRGYRFRLGGLHAGVLFLSDAVLD